MDDRFLGLNFLPAQTAMLDSNGRIIFVNDAWVAFARANGYRGRNFVGTSYLGVCERAQGAEKSQADLFGANLRAVLNGAVETFELVYPCHGPDTKRWFKVIARNLGQRTLVTHVDISAQHRQFSPIGNFCENAKLMHDLRSPLTTILGFSAASELLPPHQQNWTKAREYFQLIHKSGSRMLDLVNDILEAESQRSLNNGLTETVVLLRSLALEICSELSPMSRESNVRVECNISDDVALRADEKKLWKVFTNLVSNAIKYTRQGGSVTLSSCYNHSGGIEVTVKDTGIGVAEEMVPAIFEPFTRVADEATKQTCDGTGLGLSIVHDLVQQHEGTILVSSAVDQGTKFVVQFPAWRTAHTEIAANLNFGSNV